MEVLLEGLTALGSAKVKKSDDLVILGWAGCSSPYALRQVFHHLYIYIYFIIYIYMNIYIYMLTCSVMAYSLLPHGL